MFFFTHLFYIDLLLIFGYQLTLQTLIILNAKLTIYLTNE